MSRSVAAINQGGEYQALLFWFEAARLFMPYSPVGHVGYEHQAVRSFDDVVVFYSRPVLDEWGDPVSADYYQSKFHVTYNGAFTYSNLIDPEFISAETVSLLQRLHDARLGRAADGRGARFYITSPWHVDHNHPLGKIVSATNGEFRLDKLFPPGRGLTRVRQAWRSHLNIDSDDELRMTIRPFRIWAGALPLDLLRRMTNRELQVAGFRSMQDDSRIFQYTELIRSLHAEGRTLFTQADLRAAFTEIMLKRAQEEEEWRLEPLKIPDRDVLRWDPTHPLEQIKWTRNKNAACGSHYINVVKAIKWWHRNSDKVPKYPKGYPLEHLIGVCCPDGIEGVGSGVTRTLEAIVSNYAGHYRDRRVPEFTDHGIDHNVWHRITPEDFIGFYEEVSLAADIARRALDAKPIRESALAWRELFGDAFPEPPEGGDDSGGNDPSSGDRKGGFTQPAGRAEPRGSRYA